MEETISSRCVTCTTKVPILLKKLIKTNGLILVVNALILYVQIQIILFVNPAMIIQ